MSHDENKSRLLWRRASYFLGGLLILSMVIGGVFWGAHEYARRTYVEPAQTHLVIDEAIQSAFFNKFSAVHKPEQRTLFPDFDYLDVNGQKQRFRMEEDEYVLVNIWASWCPPCLVELPDLERLNAQLPDHIRVFAISADQGMEQEGVAAFLKQRGIWPDAANQDKGSTIMRNAPIRGLPTSFLLAGNGEILYIFEGAAPWTSREALAFFQSIPPRP